MLRRLINALSSSPPRPAATLAQVTSENVTLGVVANDPSTVLFEGRPVPVYPDKGVACPAVTPDVLIESQRRKINELHQVSSFSREDFDALIIPAIRRYAEYVHLLPASESQHHCGQGGLFRHGLEVAFNAALACEGRVFAFDRWASERDKLVPRWRMCAILGGMVHDMGKPIIDVGAVDSSGNLSWNPHGGSLYQWLVEKELKEYFISWKPGARHKRHEAFNSVALYRIVPDATMRWLTEHGGQEPLDALILALSGVSDPNNPLASIIKQADSKSVSKDIQEARTRLAASGQGGVRALAVRLARAMHDLIQDGAWQVNKVGSPIWVTSEGVFGLHSAAIRGAVELLRDQGDSSLPNDYSAALDVLADWGYLHPYVLPNGQQFNTWNIRITAQDRGKEVTFDSHAIRFARDEILPRAMIPPEVVQAHILGVDGKPLTSGGVIAAPAPTAPPQEAQAPTSTAAAAHAVAATPAQMPLEDDSANAMPLAAVDEVVESPAFLLGASTGEGLLLSSGDDGSGSPSGGTQGAPAQPQLRDRAQELDPRDEALLEARQQMSRKWPPESHAAASAFFKGQGTEGDLVLTIARRAAMGELKEGEHIFEHREHIYFRYPEAFACLGMDEDAIRRMLEEKGWTERDAATMNKMSVTLNLGGGRKYTTVRFNENMSQAVRMLLPARDGSAVVQANEKRRMPLGPYIDETVADALHDKVNYAAQDSVFVRPAFHQFALVSMEESGGALEHLEPDAIRTLLADFVKAHPRLSPTWVQKHLTSGDNAWMTRQATAQRKLSFNARYRLDVDLAEQAARAQP